MLGRIRPQGRCWAASSSRSSRAIHGEVVGLDIGRQHVQRFDLLRHPHKPQKRPYPIYANKSRNAQPALIAGQWGRCEHCVTKTGVQYSAVEWNRAKVAVRNVVAPAPQIATSGVRCMMSTFCEVTECPAQHSSEVCGLGAKGKGFVVVADFQHTFSVLRLKTASTAFVVLSFNFQVWWYSPTVAMSLLCTPLYVSLHQHAWLLGHGVCSAGLTIVANVAIATDTSLFGAPQSAAIKKSVSRNSCLILFVQLRNKRHKIAVTQCCHFSWFVAKSSRIFLLLYVKFPIYQSADFLAGFYQPFGRFSS